MLHELTLDPSHLRIRIAAARAHIYSMLRAGSRLGIYLAAAASRLAARTVFAMLARLARIISSPARDTNKHAKIL